MSQDLDGTWDPMPSTDELMHVDTSFLEPYRRGAGERPLPPPDRDSPHQRGVPLRAADAVLPGARENPRTGLDAPAQDPASLTGPAAPSASAGLARRGQDHDVPLAAPVPRRVAEDATPQSLRLTDRQEAVQNSAAGNGGSSGADDTTSLPQTGFRLGGVKSQPHIKSLPDAIVSAMREQLRAAAVRELGADDEQARRFSDRLGQGTLVTSFLAAQLDLRLDADPATERATALFRSRDPLLGSIAARLDDLESREAEQTAAVHDLRAAVADVQRTAAVVEQMLSYAVADRTENFLRGSHDLREAPITHKHAVALRDKARDETESLARIERDREGRPIR